MRNLLTIAGSDSSGGAGIQADIKTFSALGTYGMSVITAITAQNTQGVYAIQNIDIDVIEKQIDAIFEDIEVHAVKIGMLSEIGVIIAIANKLKQYNPQYIVLDPVMISKTGFKLLNDNAKEALIKHLFPISTVITPNTYEAEELTHVKINSIDDMKKSAKELHNMGSKYVLVKGGTHNKDATDVLFDGKEFIEFTTKKIETNNTHGTGCTLSSAIAAFLAMDNSVYDSVKKAKDYITIAIEHSLHIGKGNGPTHHFYELYKKAGLEEFGI